MNHVYEHPQANPMQHRAYGSGILALAVAIMLTLWGTFAVAAASSAPASGQDPLGSQAENTAVVLAIDPIEGHLAIGQVFTVTVQVAASTQMIDGAAAYLDYDPTRLQVEQVTPVGPLNIVIQNTFDNVAGQTDFAAGSFSTPANGTFSIALIRLRAVGSGAAPLVFNLTTPRNSDVTSAGISVLTGVTNAEFSIAPPESITFHASGGEGYVDLTWTRQGLGSLSGFNLYRATSEGGSYTRANSEIILPDQQAFRDTAVTAGQTYWYKIAVVRSDSSEWEHPTVVTATPVDTVAPTIVHTPIAMGPIGQPVTLTADVTDNVGVRRVVLYYRQNFASTYISRTMQVTTGSQYAITLEGALMTLPGIQYYIEAGDDLNVVRQGSAEAPYWIVAVDVAVLTLPDAEADQSEFIQIPIMAHGLFELMAADLIVTFDPAVLRANAVANGSATQAWSLASNTNVPGEVRIAMASSGATVSGSGELATIQFEVVGAPGATTTMTVIGDLNDGTLPTESIAGQFSVSQVYNLDGAVRFWNEARAIDGVELTLTGNRTYSATSNNLGAFLVSGARRDAYTLTPAKADDVNGISAYDAALVLQHAVGLETLTGPAALAADTNQNNKISSMDAAYILQKSVGLIGLPFPGATTVWKFDPPTLTYADLTADQMNQDFTGVLLGDVSGNWHSSTGGAMAQLAQTAARVHLGAAEVMADGVVAVPILFVPGEQASHSLELVIAFAGDDFAALEPALTGETVAWLVSTNRSEPDQLRIAMAGAVPVSHAGTVAVLRFTPRGAQQMPAVIITDASTDESDLPAIGASQQLFMPQLERR